MRDTPVLSAGTRRASATPRRLRLPSEADLALTPLATAQNSAQLTCCDTRALLQVWSHAVQCRH